MIWVPKDDERAISRYDDQMEENEIKFSLNERRELESMRRPGLINKMIIQKKN